MPALVLALGLTLLVAGPAPAPPPPPPSGGVPTAYTALTDRRLRLEPPLPPMGPRGSVISDPTFGTRILRVTDGALVHERPNRAWYANDGSVEAIQWNVDSTRFLVVGAGGDSLVFDFNRTAFTATRRAMPGGLWYLPVSNPVWDLTNPALLYGGAATGVSRYDVVAEISTPVWDTTALGGTPRSLSMGINRRLAGYIGNQDTATIVVAKDLGTDHAWTLDTQAGTINGSHLPNWVSFGVHNIRMGQEGRYVVITAGSGSPPAGIAIWDLEAGTIKWCRVRCGGHKVSAYGIFLNNDNLAGGPYLGYQVLKRAVSALDSPSQLIPLPLRPVKGTDSHYSWGNAKPTALVPVIASSTGEGLGDGPVRDVWDREIVAIATDGSGTVWRLAHHRSLFHSFYDGPHATVSRDGQYILFESNWGRTLGPDENGAPRQDVFVLELKAP